MKTTILSSTLPGILLISAVLLGAILLAGCQYAADPSNANSLQPVWVGQDLGLKQCGQTLGNDALRQRQQSLGQNQVQVFSAHCADDGMMRIQRCGASQGRLGIYKIAAFQLTKAQSLGFKQVQANQYQQVACS